MIISKQEFIEIFPYFKNTDAMVVEAILAESHCLNHPTGTVLLNEGDSCESMELVLSGEKRVYKANENGREITLYEVGPGEICLINASCIMAKSLSPVNAVALSSLTILHIPASTFRRLMTEYEQIRKFFYSVFSQTFADIVCLLQEVVFKKLDQRLTDYLIERSENNELHATHQQIADDLGTSREVVSRLLKEFERQGNVSLSRKHIYIKNL
jgi:CRP/FNR family transcriptional regulator